MTLHHKPWSDGTHLPCSAVGKTPGLAAATVMGKGVAQFDSSGIVHWAFSGRLGPAHPEHHSLTPFPSNSATS